MAFIVEDGTGVKGATSYASLQEFKDYFSARKEDISSITDDTIQQLLIAATDYIDTRWGLQFFGTRKYKGLAARSYLTLTGLPVADETVTVGTQVYTWKATPTLDTEIEIGVSALQSLSNLAVTLGRVENEDFLTSFFADPDVASLAIFTARDGIATTETMTNGSFNATTSSGSSAHRQRLEFPRVNLRDDAGQLVLGVPYKLRSATIEYAFRANTTTLAPDPAVDPSGNRVTKNKVGPIEVQYAENTTPKITKAYPLADRLLNEYVFQRGTVTRF